MAPSAGTRRIPFLDLITPHVALEEELVEAFRRAVRAAAFVGGAEVEGFEREFAAFCGAKHCVGVSNGTDALRLAYLAVGVRPGDEVITVPNTFIATTESLSQVGGVVRFVDVDPDTMNMDASQLEAAITPRTVGVVPVHLYGQPANMDAIQAVAQKNGLWLIEDAAQAHGARYGGKPAGSFGALGCFSFYPGKNLGALGEGGAVVTSDTSYEAQVRRLREHGQSRKYFHDVEGYNGRLDALQAAFLRIKLRRLEEWNAGRRRAAAWYRQRLADIPDVTVVAEAPQTEPAYHLFVVRVPERDRVREFLETKGVGTGLHYPVPLHLQRAYHHLGLSAGAFPVAERAADEILSLPMFPGLTIDQVGHVVAALAEFFAGRPRKMEKHGT